MTFRDWLDARTSRDWIGEVRTPQPLTVECG